MKVVIFQGQAAEKFEAGILHIRSFCALRQTMTQIARSWYSVHLLVPVQLLEKGEVRIQRDKEVAIGTGDVTGMHDDGSCIGRDEAMPMRSESLAGVAHTFRVADVCLSE